MSDVVPQHFFEGQYLGLSVNNRQENHSKGRLKLGMFEDFVEYDFWEGVALEFDDHPHASSIGLVSQRRNAFDLFVFDQLRDLLQQAGFVDLKRQLVNDNAPCRCRTPQSECGHA